MNGIMSRASLMVGRRGMLLGAAAALCVPSPAAEAAAPAGQLMDGEFELWRKGSKIGLHRVAFTRRPADLQVVSEVDLAVKFAMITVYRYRQAAQDLWQEGRLVASKCTTDDNGAVTELELMAANGRLQGYGANGRIEVALGTMTDLCFWNPAVVRQRGLIDSQTGEFAQLAIQDGAQDAIMLDGMMVRTEHYSLAATKGRAGDVWYDGDGRLVQAVIRTRGEIIEYRRKA